jgi:Tol biopolymer transport system component
MTERATTIAVGTAIGPYEVVGWLGGGGMGEVYRARDSRLARDVAIKLISDPFAADTGRAHRFEQEARAAGQLNHPNILAVYDTGVHAGAPFIVSELLEGRSLRTRILEGALSAHKAIDYARQIADGLAAAHDKNIVHRDVKPDNLFITNSGRIKILDFGVAKLTSSTRDASAGTVYVTETAAGMVVGTAAYMSPEQVRGEAVDARSDIFSAGIVLHEMLTGRPAFSRDTAAETMTAVLKEDPAAPLPADVPASLARIVARCLEKRPEMRFQSARDFGFALEVLTGTAATAAPAVVVSPGHGRGVAVTAIVLLSVLAAAAGWFTRGSIPAGFDSPLRDAEFTRVTDWEGAEGGAEISPDGRFIAFLADKAGEFDLWLTQTGTGRFVNLTADIAALRPPRSDSLLRTFGFTGDGAELWFSVNGDPGLRKMLLPLTGGAPRPFLDAGLSAPSWSPDGARVVYFSDVDGDPFFLADRNGGNAVRLAVNREGVQAAGLHNHNPVWSMDGQWIYFVHGSDPSVAMEIQRVRPNGGPVERLTPPLAALNFVTPIDARTLVYVARETDGSGPWLWALDVDSRATRRVIASVDQYTSVAATRDGHRVVATLANPTATLWRVPLRDRPAGDGDIQPYPVAAGRALAPRFRGTTLYYLSGRDGRDGLWRAEDGRASEVWKSMDGALSGPAAISPDGSRVVVTERMPGKRRLIIMSADGTGSQTLGGSIDIQGSANQGTADWSPDGGWIVAGGRDEQGPGLFKIPADGGAPVRLLAGQAVNPVWSPRGDLIVYSGAFVAGQADVLGVRPDGSPVHLPKVRARPGGYRFLPGGSGLVYLPGLDTLDAAVLDLNTNTIRTVARFTNLGISRTFDITADGKYLVFDRIREQSDVVLIEVPK